MFRRVIGGILIWVLGLVCGRFLEGIGKGGGKEGVERGIGGGRLY